MQFGFPVIAGGGDNAAGCRRCRHGGTRAGYVVARYVRCVFPGYGRVQPATPIRRCTVFATLCQDTWHLMSVLLSAASCLQWFADSVVEQPVADLLQRLDLHQIDRAGGAYFLPYLSGERTPHNNPYAKGSFFGLTHSTDKAALTHAVLEGVSLAFADGVDVLHAAGAQAREITLIGGGSAQSLLAPNACRRAQPAPDFSGEGGDVGTSVRGCQVGPTGGESQQRHCPGLSATARLFKFTSRMAPAVRFMRVEGKPSASLVPAKCRNCFDDGNTGTKHKTLHKKHN